MSSTKLEPPEPGQTVVRRTTTTTYSRKLPWLPLLLAIVLIPLIIAALATLTGIGRRDHIQNDLTSRSRAALQSAGFSGTQVSFDGRDATLRGVPAGEAATASGVVGDVNGVRTVDIAGAGSGSSGAVAPLDVSATADKIVLTGNVPDDATKKGLIAGAQSKAGSRQVIDNLTIAEGTTSALDAAGVTAVVGALGAEQAGVNAKFDGQSVTLTGVVPSEAAKGTIEQQVKADSPNLTVVNQLTVAPPVAMAPPPAVPPPGAGFDKGALQKQIDGFIAAQGLNFVPDTNELTSDGESTVTKVADALKAAPAAKIEIDGFVADTGGSEPAAKALSQHRAQQVKDQLAAAGIATDRMTALGFGTERQIASNNTASGMAANRRVEIIVL